MVEVRKDLPASETKLFSLCMEVFVFRTPKLSTVTCGPGPSEPNHIIL